MKRRERGAAAAGAGAVEFDNKNVSDAIVVLSFFSLFVCSLLATLSLSPRKWMSPDLQIVSCIATINWHFSGKFRQTNLLYFIGNTLLSTLVVVLSCDKTRLDLYEHL